MAVQASAFETFSQADLGLDRNALLNAGSRQLKVLLIEDNKDAAKTLGLLLSRYGHQVKMAYAAPQGIDIAQEWLPDVVVCDLGLPGMDGYQVAQKLRSTPATSATRLLALSGHGFEDDRRRSQAAGFDLHLTKPADPEELQRLLAVPKLGA